MDDLVIRGGTVVDGTGAPATRADVAVSGGRIVAVGAVDVPAGARVLDADGMLVTPGFVDIHTHFDGQATWDPVLAPSAWHGVTTIAMGNCGVGFAPARPHQHDWLIGLLEGVEDIPGTALAEGLTWGWESFPEYLDVLGRMPRTVDVGVHVPHAPLRAYVMGERGADHTEQPTTDEVVAMARLVAEALEAGAIGFATSRTYVHRTKAGANIGTLSAGDEELLTIAAVLRDHGDGVTQLISDCYLSDDEELAYEELALIEAFARTSGRPLSFTVQQPYHAPDRWRLLLGRAAALQAAGVDVKGQVAPRPIGTLLGLQASINPLVGCPTYVAIADRPLGERVALLRDPDRKARILVEHADLVRRLPDGLFRQIVGSTDVMFRLGDPVDYALDTSRSVAAEAARLGVDPTSSLYDALLDRGGEQLLYLPLFNFARHDLRDVHEMITSPHTLFGLSDAGAHCGAISDASFTTSTLLLWHRDAPDDQRVPLEQLVHGHTQRNARHVGWLDRGVVAPGYLADLNVIDFEGLACSPPELVHDLPAGGRRLVQRASGYRATVKAGSVTFLDGEHTGELPGGLLRGRRSAPH
jgi:N-acyl-D-aspartate/D-glutamate deacylase